MVEDFIDNFMRTNLLDDLFIACQHIRNAPTDLFPHPHAFIIQ